MISNIGKMFEEFYDIFLYKCLDDEEEEEDNDDDMLNYKFVFFWVRFCFLVVFIIF